MALLGSLVLGFQVRTDTLSKGLSRAGGVVDNFVGGLSRAAGLISGFGGALLGLAGAASFGAALGNSFKSLDELGATADKIGATVEELSALRFAAEQSDVSFEILAGGLSKLSIKLGQAKGGSDAAQNSFGDLGLDAERLASIPLGDALAEVSTRIAAMRTSSEQSAAAVSIFGKSGADLLPLLKLGGEGVAQLRAEAERLGLVVSGTDVARVKEANDAIDKVKAALAGVFNTVAIQVAPWITEFSKRLLESGVFGANASATITTGLEWIVNGIAFAADSLKYFEAGFHFLRQTLATVAAAGGAIITGLAVVTVGAINGMLEAVGLARNDSLDATTAALREFTEAAGTAANDAGAAASAALAKPSVSAGVKSFFAELKTGAETSATALTTRAVPALEATVGATAELSKKVGEMTGDWQTQIATFGMSSREVELFKLAQEGATDSQLGQLKALDAQLTAQEALKKAMDEGKSIVEENKSPLEKYNERLDKLRDLLSKGAVDQTTFDRATMKAFDDLQQASGGGGEIKFAGAADKGSVEAMRTIQRSRAMGSGRDDPLQTIARANDMQLLESKRANSYLRILAQQAEGNSDDLKL